MEERHALLLFNDSVMTIKIWYYSCGNIKIRVHKLT